MAVADLRAFLVLVLFLLSMLAWVGLWLQFVFKAGKRQTASSHDVKSSALRIGVGACLSGLLLVVMGLVLQPPPSGGIPTLGYFGLFTVCPSLFALVVLAEFLRTSIEIRRKQGIEIGRDDEENHVE